MIAKRRDVGLGGVECPSRELEPSNHCTIELADVVMSEIAQPGKLRTGFIFSAIPNAATSLADEAR